MKLLRVWYLPEADVEFTLTDVWSLILFSERHHDYKCRELSLSGGTLTAMRSRFESQDENATIICRLDASAADLLAKCGEQDPLLMHKLMPIVKKLNDEWRKMNAENL